MYGTKTHLHVTLTTLQYIWEEIAEDLYLICTHVHIANSIKHFCF